MDSLREILHSGLSGFEPASPEIEIASYAAAVTALAALGKRGDAIKKLLDYEVKVDQLEAAGRISAESAAQLRADAEATIACLQSSST